MEPQSGDLVIRQTARNAHPGLFGISSSVLNLKPEVEFAVPDFGGQRFGGGRLKGKLYGVSGPSPLWQAGLVVGSLPGAGSFAVFADDARVGPKYLKIYEGAQGLNFLSSELVDVAR